MGNMIILVELEIKSGETPHQATTRLSETVKTLRENLKSDNSITRIGMAVNELADNIVELMYGPKD